MGGPRLGRLGYQQKARVACQNNPVQNATGAGND